MKVEIINLSKEAREKRDYCDALEIKINGYKVFRVRDGEHEDNYLFRNFKDCYGIDDLIKSAYEAGKSGEELEIKYLKVEEL